MSILWETCIANGLMGRERCWRQNRVREASTHMGDQVRVRKQKKEWRGCPAEGQPRKRQPRRSVQASLVAQQKRIHLPSRRHRFYPWVRKIPWRREWQPTPIFLPGEFDGPKKKPSGLQSMELQRVRHNQVTNTHEHIQVSILFQIIFLSKLLHSIQ